MFFRLRPYISAFTALALTVMVGMAAMNNQNNLLFWIFGVLLSAAALSLAVSTLIIRAVQVRRLDPHYGAVGEPLIVRYSVNNRSRWMSLFNVHIREEDRKRWAISGQRSAVSDQPSAARGGEVSSADRQSLNAERFRFGWRRFMPPASAWVMHAGPRETVHGEAVFWPVARGEAVFDSLRIYTTFPFGVLRRSRVLRQQQHTLIYPMLYELRRGVLASIAPMGLMGSKIAHHAGAGDDYFGLREYRPGDSLRHISWKRTARTDQLVTIERTSPAPAKLRVVLDFTVPTERLPAAEGDLAQARAMEEKAISLAASLIHAADLDGFETGLTIVGFGTAPRAIAVRRNQWHFHKMMAALAEIDLDQPRKAGLPMPVRDAERVALVVIAPDRIQPLGGRENATYLTAAQLDSLAVRPLGWQEGRGIDDLRLTIADSSARRQSADGKSSIVNRQSSMEGAAA